MKRGKPQFLKPGETAPEIDDEDAHTDKRKEKVKPKAHDSGFKDLQEELEKKRKTDLDDLEKYRPRNFYKEDVDFERPGYDIDDSPWDSHYQVRVTVAISTRDPVIDWPGYVFDGRAGTLFQQSGTRLSEAVVGRWGPSGPAGNTWLP